jgi:prepilin-type N-terminal cleavage/methylation domain-containing protein
MGPCGLRSEQRGFSLLEILVALFLLVIIVTAVTRTSSNAHKVQSSAYYVEQASAYAQGKMDQLSAASLRSVAPGADTVQTPLGPVFYRSWQTTDLGGSKEVEVTVNWLVSGKTHGVKLATVVQ